MKTSSIFTAILILFTSCLQAQDDKLSRRETIKKAITKKYDKNNDGKLDDSERAEILKQYDKNGNKKLDNDERKALVQSLKNEFQKSAKNKRADIKGAEKRTYKTVGDSKLSLFMFKPEGHSAESKAPAIVFFHGGGWKSGSPTQFQDQAKHLAGLGMVAISVQYRLSSTHNAKVDDCIEDAKSAMRWVRGKAGELGIDPTRIASGGGSAGGHLAACVALMDGFNAKADDTKISAAPNAMVLFNPAMVLATNELLPSEINEKLKEVEKSGRSRAPAKEISPFTHVKKKQPPCIMYFGTEDRLKAGADIYCKVSKEAGNDCKIIEYEGQNHSFFNRGKYKDLTIEETVKFFQKLGWIK